jgi:hypothetical protein
MEGGERFVCLVVDSYPSFLPVESTNRKIESYLDGSTINLSGPNVKDSCHDHDPSPDVAHG